MQCNPGATDWGAQQQQQQQQEEGEGELEEEEEEKEEVGEEEEKKEEQEQEEAVVVEQQPSKATGAAPKQLLKNGVSSRKKEAFPPMLISPLVFLLCAIKIVNSTRNTTHRFILFDGLSTQLLGSPPGAGAFVDITSVEDWWDWLEALLPATTRSRHGGNWSSSTMQSDLIFLTLSQTRPGCAAPASALLHAPPNRTESSWSSLGYQRMPTWSLYSGNAGVTPGGSVDYPTWAPYHVRNMCASANESAALVMRRYERRPALAAAAHALLPHVPHRVQRNLNQGRPGTPHFTLGNASNALLCNFLCDSITGCGTWTTVEEVQDMTAEAVYGGTDPLCTLYALARDSPPPWVVDDEVDDENSPQSPPPNKTCTSGQLPMQFSHFGTNWQCPGSESMPRFAIEPGRPPSEGEGQMHDHFYECDLHNKIARNFHRGFSGSATAFNSSARMHRESEVCVYMGDSYRGYNGGKALTPALRRLNWIDLNTSEVTLTMMMKNSFLEGGALARIRFQLHLLAGGAVRPAVSVDSVLPFGADVSTFGALGALFALYVIYILLDGVHVMVMHKRARRFKEWFRQNSLWLVIDGAVFLSGAVFYVMVGLRDFAYLPGTTVAYSNCSGLRGAALGFASTALCEQHSTGRGEAGCNTSAVGECSNSTAHTLALLSKRAQNFNHQSDLYFYCDNFSQFAGTFVIFMLTLRMFRFLRLQPRLAIIVNTLARAAPDLAHFLLVFIVVLVGYAASFNCNYGGQVRMFATPGAAIFTTFIMAMGSYDDAYAALVNSEQGSGSWGLHALIIAFIFIVVLVMLNIFLAIVVDSYADVKNELQNAQRVPSVLESSLLKLHRLRHSTARTAARWWQWTRAQATLAFMWADPRNCVATLRNRRRGLPSSRRMIDATDDVEMAPVAAGAGRSSLSSFIGSAPLDAAVLVARPVRDVAWGCLGFMCSLPACLFGGKAVTRWPEMSRALDSIPDTQGGTWVSAAALQRQLPHLTLAQAQHLVDKYGRYGEQFERDAAAAAGKDYVARSVGVRDGDCRASEEGGGSSGSECNTHNEGAARRGGWTKLRKRMATYSESGAARRVSESEAGGLLNVCEPGRRDK